MIDGETLVHIEIQDPPTYYDHGYKKPKYDEEKQKLITKKRYYLTNNIFFGNNTHWKIQYDIINYAKDWFQPFLSDTPKIRKCRIELTYYSENDTWDLDNKSSFWIKILLDLLKTPTQKQQLKARQNGKWIRSVEAIPDDTVKYINGISAFHAYGKHRMEIKIIERKGSQTELF